MKNKASFVGKLQGRKDHNFLLRELINIII